MADPHAELSPLEAYQRVLGFAAERGENALRLALHAAIPQVLRPELLHLIRLNFVPESLDDAATEADVLFAPFCAKLGNDYYRFDANARLQLLTQLDPAYAVDAVPRSRQVAGFLLAWCERRGSPLATEDDRVFAAFLDVERWVALAFFDPDAAAAQLAAAVKHASEGGAVAARIRIGGLASALATPLAGHGRLLAYAAGLEALELGDVGRAEDLLEPLGDREVRVGDITLRSPRRVLEDQLRRRTTLTPMEQTEVRAGVAWANAWATGSAKAEMGSAHSAEAKQSPPVTLRVFLSAPGDVTNERAMALQVIERLRYEPSLRGKIFLETVTWDQPGTETPPPSAVVAAGLRKPSECDIAVVVVGSRMGTPLPAEYRKPDGSVYLSGTEWEYLDAVEGWKKNRRPEILVYRRTETVLPDRHDPRLDEKLHQLRNVHAFFADFLNPDGSIRSTYNAYVTPEEFRKRLDLHLRVVIHRLLEKTLEKDDAEESSVSRGRAVFISYAHADNSGPDPAARWLDRLLLNLKPLAFEELMTVATDRDIGLGDDWHAQIQANLNRAGAAVLLVSPAFLASEYIRNNDLPVLLYRAKSQGLRIVPVILRPCLFAATRFKYPDPRTGPEEFSLASLQSAGSPAKALNEMSEGEQDRALLSVAQALERWVGRPNAAPSEVLGSAKVLPPEVQSLLDELARPETTHRRRAEIGDALDQLGDPRPGVGLRPDGVPDLVWLPVPGGRVRLEGIRKPFEVEPFHIAKHPVTYRQYRAFLDDPKGYRNRAWWTDLRREEKPGEPRWPVGNRPAERVSWYDAMAYARWLSARFGYEVRLPTEWEWQRAATGGEPNRVYPWGKKWDAARANTYESGLGQTTAVGMYPQGASRMGALDLAGNVWEWCLNDYDKPERQVGKGDAWRVVRGGSWYFARVSARCAYRTAFTPGDRDSYALGLRLVCMAPIA